MQGAVAPLQVYCQRRHLQVVVIPDLISLAYLRFFTVMARGKAKYPNIIFMFTRSPQSEHILDVILFMIHDDDFVFFHGFGDYCHGIVRFLGVCN